MSHFCDHHDDGLCDVERLKMYQRSGYPGCDRCGALVWMSDRYKHVGGGRFEHIGECPRPQLHKKEKKATT